MNVIFVLDINNAIKKSQQQVVARFAKMFLLIIRWYMVHEPEDLFSVLCHDNHAASVEGNIEIGVYL